MSALEGLTELVPALWLIVVFVFADKQWLQMKL
jgi:hypothetical protein